MKNKILGVIKSFIFLILMLHLSTVSATTDSSLRLSGHIPSKAIEQATYLHHVDESTHVPLTFVLPLRNSEELQELLTRLYDPADQEHYGKYLSSDEFVSRFAPTQEDYDAVAAYAEQSGLTIHSKHPNRLLLNASGSSQSVESAFNLRLHHYLTEDGRQFHAPDNNPEVPAEVASIIQGVVGLDNHAVFRPFSRRMEMMHASNATSNSHPSGPGGGFAPADIELAYNLSSIPAKGTNQVIALFELAGYQASDINTYTSTFGLPAAKLINVPVDGGSSAGINPEVTLDIELALALAPMSEIYVYEGPNSNQGVLDTYNKIATDNIAKQVSTSWGLGENFVTSQYLQAENTIFQQMAAQGQTIFAAAGDSGAYDDYASNSSKALVVDDPASQPYVTGVGGTSLKVNSQTGAYLSESVWNNGLGNGAGGGGVSTVWTIPSWQANVATVYSKTHRNVPDVALNADTNTGYAIFYDGQWQIYGGTSCAAPLWAAFTACVNQELIAEGKPSLGFANPKLYAIATGASYSENFHDVTSGNNLFYNAGVGYDNASGWGSFNGADLYATLTSSTVTAKVPHLNIIMNHNSPLPRGRIGVYHIIVSNTGNAPTSGAVNVHLSLPTGLTFSSFTGSGWVFNNNTFTFTDMGVLQPGASYPTIVLNVHVATNAPHTVIPSATVSGGGSVSSTVTNLTTTQ